MFLQLVIESIGRYTSNPYYKQLKKEVQYNFFEPITTRIQSNYILIGINVMQTDVSVRYLWLFRCTCMEPELDGDTRFTEMRRPEKYLHLLKTIILLMHLAKPKRKQSKNFQALCPATREKLLCKEPFPCLLR